MFHSPHESFFEFKPQDGHSRKMAGDENGERDGQIRSRILRRDSHSRTTCSALPADQALTEQTIKNVDVSTVEKHAASTQPPSMVTYAGRSFDPRRMCGTCTEELRRAIVSSGHDLEIWHAVDHERRALLTGQRQNDLSKARWAERERQDRQVRHPYTCPGWGVMLGKLRWRSLQNLCLRIPDDTTPDHCVLWRYRASR